ncbi:hypothetical protein N800_05550 [Lysobacter daejeonensis GH1-9]|uniref:KAP NTPase domain-containing protein n=2 Tax=Aerolutibacter TaxID=3382701 RepID=A0A0A0EU29_9GAMM|nr:hypothetical protein N800_05550 [Lysobacter daejeonensis GH1-9]
MKVAVYQATQEFDHDLRRKWWRWIHPQWIWWRIQSFLPIALDVADIPYLRTGLAKSYDALSYYLVKGRLICFDDIERRGEGLPMLDFLGLVSQLVDKQGCRVVVILNTGGLNATDQKVWDDNKEKVFHGEMTYAPSIEQSIDLGLETYSGETWYPIARKALSDLRVSNIRIVQRTGRHVKAALDSAGKRELYPRTIESIVRVLALLTYAHSGQAEGAPPLDFVMRSGPFDMALYSMSDKKDRTEKELAWMQLISDYQIFVGDELDKALCQMVINGYPDPALIASEVDAYQSNVELESSKEAFEKAWSLFHDTLAENQEELADALEKAWPPVSHVERAHNLQSTVRLLRLLGRPEVGSKFIKAWIEQRGGERLGDLDEVAMFGPIDDPELVEAIRQAQLKAPVVMDLKEALELLGSSGGISDAAIQSVAKSTPERIASVLTEHAGAKARRAIKTVLDFGTGNPLWAEARQKMRQACEEIAKRSPLSAERMSRYGVTLSASGPDAKNQMN